MTDLLGKDDPATQKWDKEPYWENIPRCIGYLATKSLSDTNSRNIQICELLLDFLSGFD